MAPGFRRRILIEPAAGQVTAELEDDWHRMVVTLRHAGGIVRAVESEMKRWPWTTCRGAMTEIEATFVGVPLAEFAKRGARASNCTHLHDLALFAAGHAEEREAVAYDIFVSDPAGDRRDSVLMRNGEQVLTWSLDGERFAAPALIEGLTLRDLGAWIAAQDKATQEAARVLRWASIMARGRALDIPDGVSGAVFPTGACYTFQPEMAKQARRMPSAHTDFARCESEPMADRAAAFQRL